MIKKNKKIALIAGGGTGGHLYPAITIGQKLEEENIIVKYIGSKYGIEKTMFKALGLDYHLLNITGIQRNLSLRSLYVNLLFPLRFIISYIHSVYLIKALNPSIIIGTGGYSSGLPLIAGVHFKIPTLIQDQNSIPGIITKTLKKKVNKICIAYELAADYLNCNNCIITGNPIQQNLKVANKNEAKKSFNLNEQKNTILILGGSQGSSPINNHFLNNIDFYLRNNLQIIWQCGENEYKSLL